MNRTVRRAVRLSRQNSEWYAASHKKQPIPERKDDKEKQESGLQGRIQHECSGQQDQILQAENRQCQPIHRSGGRLSQPDGRPADGLV